MPAENLTFATGGTITRTVDLGPTVESFTTFANDLAQANVRFGCAMAHFAQTFNGGPMAEEKVPEDGVKVRAEIAAKLKTANASRVHLSEDPSSDRMTWQPESDDEQQQCSPA